LRTGIAAFARWRGERLLSDPGLWSATYYTSSPPFSARSSPGPRLRLCLPADADRYPRQGAAQLPLRAADDDPAAGDGACLGADVGPSSPLLKALHIAPPLGSPQPLYSVGGIALLYGVQHAPLVYLALRAGLMALPRDGVEAARLSGASALRVFRDIILPLSLPGYHCGRGDPSFPASAISAFRPSSAFRRRSTRCRR
jgi:iron(III) transport system permease protein